MLCHLPDEEDHLTYQGLASSNWEYQFYQKELGMVRLTWLQAEPLGPTGQWVEEQGVDCQQMPRWVRWGYPFGACRTPQVSRPSRGLR